MAIFETIVSAAITGVGSGVGVAIGAYFAQKTILRQMEKFNERLAKKKEELKEMELKKKKKKN
jgi:uncharacterized protein YneF (UPF0154 family)